MASPAIGVRPAWLSSGAAAALDASHPLAAGLFGLRAGNDWPVGSPSTRQLHATTGVAGIGGSAASTSASDAIAGFQTGPWSMGVAITARASFSQGLVTMAESPGSGTADRRVYVTSAPKFAVQIFDGGAKTATSSTVPTAGVFYVVVATCDGSTLALWVNGAMEASTSVANAGFAGFTTPEWVVGRDDPGVVSNATSSCLHLAACWRRVLSATEIARFARAPFDMLRR